MRYSIILVAMLSIPSFAYSDTIIVPDDYPTIQGAIDAAVNGDTVIVAPGTYQENIDFKGKAITVMSDQGPAVTTILSPGSGSVVTFSSGECLDSLLIGFTIRDGAGTYFEIAPGNWNFVGGGIFCHNSSPKIYGNIIRDNHADTGGGLYLNNSSAHVVWNTITANWGDNSGGMACVYSVDPIIEDNDIFYNSGIYGGGGIKIAYSSLLIIKNRICNNGSGLGSAGGIFCGEDSEVTLVNNHICRNSTYSVGSVGGGVYCNKASSVTIINNTIVGNGSSHAGGGIWCANVPSLNVVNTILRDNDAMLGPEIYISNSICSLSCCNIEGGQSSVYVSSGTLNWGAGMINADPLFVDNATSDFHLTFDSPCRGSGDNSVVTVLYDFEGDPRISYGTVDMGADEFYRHLYCMGDFTPGGAIEGKFIGPPGATPVGLFVGSGVLTSPLPTMWGEYWLQAPWFLFTLVPIPSNGILELPTTLPASIPAPYDIPMQALIGLNPDSLTNLCVLEVR